MKFSLDKGWKFHNGDIPLPFINNHTDTYMASKAGGAIGAASPDFDKSGWEDVDLPHDYAVANPIDEKYGPAMGYKKRGKAWYSKRFRLDEDDRDKQILIEFEGVTGECVVYLNGSVIGRNFSGYNSFTADATDMALYGDRINDLVVYVNADLIEGWWYEGAGIYRHVNLYKKNKLHFEHNGIFYETVKLDPSTWSVFSHITVENTAEFDEEYEISVKLYDEEDNIVGSGEGDFKTYAFSRRTCGIDFLTYSPKKWDIDEPNLYRITAELKQHGAVIDSETMYIGFRTIAADPQKGFILNGRPVKLYGVCCHQDHAGVGVAVPDAVNEYRIRLLKEMGANAYRAAHGNTSKAILDACDKYGILVMDENRQYNTAETDGLKQVRDMVMRDRNHPSVVMYSLFNEEPLQGTFTGRKLALRLKGEVEKHDGTRFTVGAMNNGLFNEDGAYNVCDITGINYQTAIYDEFLTRFPELPVIGTENCSAFMTRGCYKTDMSKNVIDMLDSECAPWGNTYRDGFMQIKKRDNIMGYFVWTGFDYRGEPTPFAYPSVSTQFGILDTCGFRKSAYYLNKSYWTDKKLAHIVSHWNYSDGETADITVFTNCSEAELFVNGRSAGKKQVSEDNTVVFENIRFEAGELSVICDGGAASDTVYTHSSLSSLELECGMERAYENDAVCINVKAVDENGKFVHDADELIMFDANGGYILGVGNGDPNSHEADKAKERRLFAGLCQAIVAPEYGSDSMTVTARTAGGVCASITVPVGPNRSAAFIPSVTEKYISTWRRTLELSDEYPDPLAPISDSDMNTWVIVDAGNGHDSIFDGKTGYAMYKAAAETQKGERIIFREITADHADIYINKEKVFSSGCGYGKRFEYVSENGGTLDITVVLESRTAVSGAGINKPVVAAE